MGFLKHPQYGHMIHLAQGIGDEVDRGWLIRLGFSAWDGIRSGLEDVRSGLL